MPSLRRVLDDWYEFSGCPHCLLQDAEEYSFTFRPFDLLNDIKVLKDLGGYCPLCRSYVSLLDMVKWAAKNEPSRPRRILSEAEDDIESDEDEENLERLREMTEELEGEEDDE